MDNNSLLDYNFSGLRGMGEGALASATRASGRPDIYIMYSSTLCALCQAVFAFLSQGGHPAHKFCSPSLTTAEIYDILTFVSMGYSQAVKARDFDSRISLVQIQLSQPEKNKSQDLLFSIQSEGLVCNRRAKCGAWNPSLCDGMASRFSVYLPSD